MQTEPNTKTPKKSIYNEVIFNEDFIGYINTLSDSIKEYFKVSKNICKNKNMLISLVEKEVNDLDSLYNNTFKEKFNYDEMNTFNAIFEKIRDIFHKIQINITSEEKNLIFFIEDAKVLFNKMREKRQELIIKKKIKSNSTSKNVYSSLLPTSQNNANINYKKIEKKNIDDYNHSQINSNIRNIKKNIPEYDINNKKNMTTRQRDIANEKNKSQKIRDLNTNKQSINKEFFDTFENIQSSGSNFRKIIQDNKGNNINNQNNEIEKLKMLNRRLTLELKKYKQSELGNNTDNSKEATTINTINIDKDKLILKLKEDLNKNNKKYFELMSNLNNYKNEIKKLQDENNILKKNNINRNNNKNIEKSLNAKLNNLILENNYLKNNLEELQLKSVNAKSEYNYKINMRKDRSFENKNNNVYEKEIELLKKKINITDKKLSEKQIQNNELNNEIILLKNKYESEISQLSRKNTELSSSLINKQNDILSLQKENFNKNKELENLKLSVNQNMYDSNNEGQNINNIKNSSNNIDDDNLNKIIENYKKENEKLKNSNNIHQDKIKYYQTQIRKIKNELFEKEEANIELENKNQQQIKKLKEDCEQKIEEITKKNKMLENSLEECQNFNSDLSQQICNLNQQTVAKDCKLLELNYQIEQIQKKLNEKEEENKKLLKTIEDLKNKISNEINDNNNNDINEQFEKLNEQLQEQQNINNDLNEELNKIKKENELLKNKIINNDKKITEYKNKEDLQDNIHNDELEKIKNENKTLKSNNEKLENQLKNSQRQTDENDGLKQLVSKLQSDKEKNDDEINLLKRENEKMKNQILRLSKTLPEEYNELQRQYNELEAKYLQQVKSKSNKSTPLKNKKSQNDIINNEEKLINELKEAKKEIDVIKKKNSELVLQLEEKEIKKNCYDNKSEDANKSNYEEEFDLRKMAKGAKDKNRSQDINIDYPGIQAIKEKYRELDFYYNSLEALVKKLLLTIQCNPKNKTYVAELCRIVGFDLETTNKILTNKNKKLLLGLFAK